MGENVAAVAIIARFLLSPLAAHVKRVRQRRRDAAQLWGQYDRAHRLDAEELRDVGAYCRERSSVEPCAVDELTWNDLNMDDVFLLLDRACSNVGEEVLYDLLHRTDVSQQTLERRRKIMRAMEGDAQARSQSRRILGRLGRGRFHGACGFLFNPRARRIAHPNAYLTLGLAPLASLLLVVISPAFLLLTAALFAVNLAVYYRSAKVFMREIASVRHIAAVIETARKLTAALPTELEDIAKELREGVGALSSVRRWSGLFAMQRVSEFDFLTDYIRIFFQLDMVCLGRLGACFVRENAHLRALYALVGEIDACTALASFAASRTDVCAPEFIDEMRVDGQEIVHPLVKDPVENDASLSGGVLVTGSNASGKSTFIKALAVNAILAQTACLCTAKSFCLPRARVATSMALRDSIIGGESYFVVEVRSLRRLLEIAKSGELAILCIDEILRGTNTTERIAASQALLRALNRENCLCIAATHDLELTRLLTAYSQLHFAETLTGEGMAFPYKLLSGPSDTRNAIALMRQMGFPTALTDEAERAAQGFDELGAWESVSGDDTPKTEEE